MEKKSIIAIPKNLDDTAVVIAQIYKVSDSYVRMIVRGRFFPTTPDAIKKANNIITLYNQYKNGKSLLIERIEQAAKFS